MRILFFSHLKNIAGTSELEIPFNNVDEHALWTKLIEINSAFASFRSTVRLARNLEFADRNTRFYDQDEVALIPPVSGG